jgi:hypothetical protein
MLHAHIEKIAETSIQILLVGVALAVPGRSLQAQSAALVDGPAGYEVVCAIHASAGFRTCDELSSARSCETEANFASRPSKESTGITFVNRSDEPVKIYWLNFHGERVLYQYLPPGGRHMQKTFIGHNWVVTALTEQCIGIFKAAPQSIAFF